MPVELKITTNTAEIESYFKNLPKESFEKAKKFFAISVLAAQKEIQQNATDKLEVRTGALRRSIGQEVIGFDLDSLRASVFSGSTSGGKPLIYAPIHEFGGKIKAKNAYKKIPGGPYLNIPIADNLTAAGVMRYTARMVFQNGGYIRKSKRGSWLVFMPGQDDDQLMFILKKQVTIKPQLGMRDAADRQVSIIINELANIIGE